MRKTPWYLAGLAALLLAAGCGDDPAEGGGKDPIGKKPDEETPAAPLIQLTAPTPDAVLPWGPVQVTGNVVAESGLAALTYSLNGEDAAPVATEGEPKSSATFDFEIEPGAGSHTLLLVALDTDGREATATVTFEVEEEPDRTLPVIEVITPVPGTFTTVRQVLVTGTATDDRGIVEATWSLDDGEATAFEVDDEGNFSFTIAPALGENVLTITVADEEGNTVGEEIPVHFGNLAAAGNQHSGAVVGSSLYTWGGNLSGQIGLGPDVTDDQLVPALIDLDDVAWAAFGQNTSAAIRKDGTVWTWGRDSDGMLGREGEASLPGQVELEDVAGVAVGNDHILFLLGDGTVWASGRNTSGQLGDGTTTNSASPVQVQGLTDVVKVAAGSAHSVALKADGTVWAWGRNTQGNLGQGTEDSDPHTAPEQVPGIENAVDVACGRDHSLAVLADGSAVGWGLNKDGQVGNGESGSGVSSPSPAAVLGLDDAVAVFAGGTMSFALRSDGSAIGWGANFNAQLGTGDSTPRTQPDVPVKGLSGLVGLGVGATHVIAADTEGNVYGWGWSFKGSMGRADAADRWAYPEPLVIFEEGELPETETL